jgi:FMN-dependent NADH-azoreductase
MKLLHIDSSVLGPHSVSRQVSAAIVDRLAKATPGLDIVYRDLTLTPLAHLSGSHLAAGQGAVPEAALQPDLAAGQAVLNEFLAADIVVLGAPMYNFTIPSQLKAWIDRIVVAGKTFKYGAQGAEGLAGNIWKPICAGYSASSGSPSPNSSPPTEFRSGRNTAKKRWPARCRRPPISTRRKRKVTLPAAVEPRRRAG